MPLRDITVGLMTARGTDVTDRFLMGRLIQRIDRAHAAAVARDHAASARVWRAAAWAVAP